MLTTHNNDIDNTTSDNDNTAEPTTKVGNYPNDETIPNGTFYCTLCKFKTTKSKLYDKHLLTKKHLYSESVIDAYNDYADLISNPSNEIAPVPADSLIRTSHRCPCGKIYKHRQSLCIHKKKCTYIPPSRDPPSPPPSPPPPSPPPSSSLV